MNWDFLRREWGAVTFVLTVLVGLVVVPLGLVFANQSPGPVSASFPTPEVSAASAPRTAAEAPTASPTPPPSPTASPAR